MNRNIVSLREIQRNYRKLINEAKRMKTPLFLGARAKPEAVLLDIDAFEDLDKKAKGKKLSWTDMKKRLDWISAGGKQGVNLAEFIHADRNRH